MAIDQAKQDIAKLAELIDHLDNLPPPAVEQLLEHLASESVTAVSEAERLHLWDKLVELVDKHRKFADADWALKPELVDRIAARADGLAPSTAFYRHQRLFGERDFDLYEERANYEEQSKRLEERRQRAVNDVYSQGGSEAVRRTNWGRAVVLHQGLA